MAPTEIANIITPNCLRVERATTFLTSGSKIALTAERSIVIQEIKPKKINQPPDKQEEKRIRTYTPAVTRVEE